MEARILKRKKSNGFIISKKLLKLTDLKTNAIASLKNEKGNKFKKKSLNEQFDNYSGDNLAKDFTWDDNVGKEIW